MSAKKRIFVAIALPEEVRQALSEKLEKWRWLPIRWLGSENWHITIIPPFYADEEGLRVTEASLKKAVRGLQPFGLSFDAIVLAPPEKRARMIWLAGPRNAHLQELKNRVEEELTRGGKPPLIEKEERALFPHVTLARFEEGDLKGLEEKTRTLEKFRISFSVASLEIVESHLKSAGAEYEVRAEIPFGTVPAAPAFEFLPHTADLRIKSRGGTREELFEHSLLGMAEYMKKGASTMKSTVTRPVETSATDTAALLANLLSKALTLGDANREVYPRVLFNEFSETHLRGTLFGVSVEEFDEDIKAVAYHEAEIVKTSIGYEVTIIYDI